MDPPLPSPVLTFLELPLLTESHFCVLTTTKSILAVPVFPHVPARPMWYSYYVAGRTEAKAKQSKAKMCNGRRHVPLCPASANEK